MIWLFVTVLASDVQTWQSLVYQLWWPLSLGFGPFKRWPEAAPPAPPRGVLQQGPWQGAQQRVVVASR